MSSDVAWALITVVVGGYGLYQIGYLVGWTARNQRGFFDIQKAFDDASVSKDRLIKALEKQRDELLKLISGEHSNEKDSRPS